MWKLGYTVVEVRIVCVEAWIYSCGSKDCVCESLDTW